MNLQKPECDVKCKQYAISIDRPKKKLKGENCMKAKGDCPDQIHSDQMTLTTVRREAGLRKWWPKAHKNKAKFKGRPSDSSPLRSDASCDGHAGGWTALMVVKGNKGELENNRGKPRDLLKNRHSDSLKKS
jgi:hypothetical protein